MKKLIKIIKMLNDNKIIYDIEHNRQYGAYIYFNKKSLLIDLNNNIYIHYNKDGILNSMNIKLKDVRLILSLEKVQIK